MTDTRTDKGDRALELLEKGVTREAIRTRLGIKSRDGLFKLLQNAKRRRAKREGKK